MSVKVRFYQFILGDVGAKQAFNEWAQLDLGQWAMTHAIETPVLTGYHDCYTMERSVTVDGYLTESDYTYYLLRWK